MPAERSLCASLRASGLQSRGSIRAQFATYQPEFINLTGRVDAGQLLQSLASVRACNLCFYGVPGTGKTSFAEYIARELDRPLMVRLASDLQSKWLGETEQRIRAAFDEAQDEGAVLFFDEVDSFLSESSGASRSWERSQVNELLQCMERFEGIFIAATNMIDVLDKAALRRFTHKVEFLPLNVDQRVAMLRNQMGVIHVSAQLSRALRTQMQRLDGLTVGDFAVVSVQAAMRKLAMTTDEMIALLESELQFRMPSRGRVMGFV